MSSSVGGDIAEGGRREGGTAPAGVSLAQAYVAGDADGESHVRAATAGFDVVRVRAAIALAKFPAVRPGLVRLALVLSPESGRVLYHTASFAGGASFSHFLFDLPLQVSVKVAVDTWGSHFWRTASVDEGELPPPSLPLPGGRWGPADVADFLADAAHARLVRFVLDALLASPADSRLVVRAAPADVAACVAAVALALPPAMLEGFTFSTCEPDPLGAEAPGTESRLIGVPDDTGGDLPDACYAHPRLGFNPATGRASPVTAAAYTHDAVAALAVGKPGSVLI